MYEEFLINVEMGRSWYLQMARVFALLWVVLIPFPRVRSGFGQYKPLVGEATGIRSQ